MIAQDHSESTREPIIYRRFINQFPLDTIKWMQRLERMNTKMCRQRISILFNQIYIHTCTQCLALINLQGLICHKTQTINIFLPKESWELLRTHARTYIYIYIYIYIYGKSYKYISLKEQYHKNHSYSKPCQSDFPELFFFFFHGYSL